MKKFSWQSMGTSFEVSIWDEISEDIFLDITETVIALSEDFDQKYSRFKRTSFVWQIAEKTGKITVDEDFMAMLKMYFDFFKLSDKKFNPLIGNMISDMGYDDQYSLLPKETIRSSPDLEKTVTILDESTISIAEPVLFDVGGVGKGYFVDKVSSLLKEKGLKHFLVNGSGDLLYEGNGEAMRAGLEHPQDPKKAIGVIELQKGALAASGSNKRNWGKYHHIIDPLSASSPNTIVSSWVLAESAVLADVLATCLFLCPPENFTSNFQFEYLLLDSNMRVTKSDGFNAELF
jgi:thiamine biosynthesis lipoprotein